MVLNLRLSEDVGFVVVRSVSGFFVFSEVVDVLFGASLCFLLLVCFVERIFPVIVKLF